MAFREPTSSTVPVGAILRCGMHWATVLFASFNSLTSTACIFDRQNRSGEKAVVKSLTFNLSGHDKWQKSIKLGSVRSIKLVPSTPSVFRVAVGG